jgi:hypothetical protein
VKNQSMFLLLSISVLSAFLFLLFAIRKRKRSNRQKVSCDEITVHLKDVDLRREERAAPPTEITAL